MQNWKSKTRNLFSLEFKKEQKKINDKIAVLETKTKTVKQINGKMRLV